MSIHSQPAYWLWVNLERTVFVRMWASGRVEVATREHPDDMWGPPIVVHREERA